MKTRLLLSFLLLSVLAGAQTYTYSTLYKFKLNGTGPAYPSALIRDSNGNFYGTSLQGGNYNAGTVFKLTPKGALTVLYTFKGATDGSAPNSIARDIRQGNLYGTTSNTVFKLTLETNGAYKFSTIFSDSANLLLGAAMLDSKGNLYGTGQYCFAADPCLWEIPAGSVWTDLYFDASGRLMLQATSSSIRTILCTSGSDIAISRAEVTFSSTLRWMNTGIIVFPMASTP